MVEQSAEEMADAEAVAMALQRDALRVLKTAVCWVLSWVALKAARMVYIQAASKDWFQVGKLAFQFPEWRDAAMVGRWVFAVVEMMVDHWAARMVEQSAEEMVDSEAVTMAFQRDALRVLMMAVCWVLSLVALKAARMVYIQAASKE